jgi:hypothetical protein
VVLGLILPQYMAPDKAGGYIFWLIWARRISFIQYLPSKGTANIPFIPKMEGKDM